jgi:hypothetical protein
MGDSGDRSTAASTKWQAAWFARRAPTTDRVARRERLVGTYQSIGSRLTVGTEGDALVLDIQPLESPEADSTIRGELLPVEGERFILRAAAIGDDLPLTFVEPNGDGSFEYLHMGARLYRRVI